MTKKLQALASYLREENITDDIDDIQEGYGPDVFTVGEKEYLVLTDDERNEEVKSYIEDSLWAFNSSFLAEETGLPEEVFRALSEKCESGNDAILALVDKTCGLDALVDSAVKADGYGHFLASYDGEEEEVTVEGENYFIYRIN